MGQKDNRAVYVSESEGRILIGNGLVEFGFSAADGGAPVSILDKQTGCELIRDEPCRKSLYRLALLRQDGKPEWLESGGASGLRWTKEKSGDAVTLTLVTSSFAEMKLEVEVRITLEPGSALSRWRAIVRGLDSECVRELTCPIISGLVLLGDPAPGEALAVPLHGEGYLFKNPYPVRDRLPLCSGEGPESADVGIGEMHLLYPGILSMQLMAFYNDSAGLYFAAHDAGQNVKSFDIGRLADWGDIPVLSMSHRFPEEPGADRTLEYDAVVGVFHGDWYDAADIYKTWAADQWWCSKKLWDRDIADWMRTGVGVLQMSNYHIPELKLNHSVDQIADTVNGLSDEIGAPLLALIFNWEGGGAWTGPAGFFPPREGGEKFKGAMKRLRDAGNYGFVYVTGGCWYLKLPYDPPFTSWDRFEKEARPSAVMDEEGNVPVGRWYAGWESTRLCAGTEYTREITASVLLGCLDVGCTVVQIDNFPCASSEACYDPSHGHPLGFGRWWSESWGEILADVRTRAKKRDPNCAITTEGISENFIPYLDMFDQRAANMEYFGHYWRGMPMGGETIPIFSYVYNEYIGAYCAAMPECNQPGVLYWTRCLGKALAQGVVPSGGRYFPEPEGFNPVTIGFYKKVVRAAAQECWPYLMFGEMLRPPEIDVPMITAQYCRLMLDEKSHRVDPQQRHEVRDRAVEHSAWRGRDGTVGLFFINVSEDPVEFDVELSAYEKDFDQTYDVDMVTDGNREGLLSGITVPHGEKIAMEPLSVVLLEIRRH